jgi:molybdopterin synthase catalytic subunit
VTFPLLAIGPNPLVLEPLIAAVVDRDESFSAGDPGTGSTLGPAAGSDGAVAAFLGLVRNHNLGRIVHYLEYEAYEPLALRAFARITQESAERWPGVRLALHHRIGRIEIGHASVAIAAASPHRADAFSVCRYAIERVKQIAPIWKREFFQGGDVWIEGATADPDDQQARATAERVACG